MLKTKDYVTLCGSFFAFVSIILSITAFTTSNRYWTMMACLFMFFSICTDTLDGLIARKLNQENDIGKEVDSLSDCVSFVVAPAVMVYCAFGGGWLLVSCGIFTMCGVLRLAWFNIEDTTDGYIGLVTPMSTSSLITYFLCTYYYELLITCDNASIKSFYQLFEGWYYFLQNIWVISAFVIILGILNLADFLRYSKKVRKKRGRWRYYIIIAAISVLIIIILLIIAPYLPYLWPIIYVIAHGWSIAAFWACIGYIVWGFITWYKLRGE